MQRFIHTKHMNLYDKTKELIGDHFDRLEQEFPLLNSAHISVEHNNHAFKTAMHVHGKRIDLSVSAEDKNLYKSIAESFERISDRYRHKLDKLQSHHH